MQDIVELCVRMIDHISNLDEDVLSNILSCLPTKDAIRTSILSKGWRYKWKCSYNLEIKEWSYDDRRDEMFVQFMNRIFSKDLHLRTFRLSCFGQYPFDDLQSWVSSAVAHNLECLVITCSLKGALLPGNLLNSTRLRELSVRSCRIVNVGAKNCAPNLISLYLNDVEIVKGVPDTSTMTFDFPVLQTFTASFCRWLELNSVKIHAPSLIEFQSNGPNDASLMIDAPQLAIFSSTLGLPNKFVLDGSSVVSAQLRFDESLDVLSARDQWRHVCQLFNKFINLEYLELSASMSEVVRVGHRCHDKLRRLELTGVSHVGELLQLLCATPSLEFLSINLMYNGVYAYEAVDPVPSCILLHLEEVKIMRFGCTTEECNLAEFLIKNGQQLKKLSICGAHMGCRIKSLLSTFPRASSCLTISVEER